jgi:hypothetical protein
MHHSYISLQKKIFWSLVFISLLGISLFAVGCNKPANLKNENILYVENDNVLSEGETYIYSQGALYKAIPEAGKLYVYTDTPIEVYKVQEDDNIKIYITNTSDKFPEENITYIYKNKTLTSVKISDDLIGRVYMNESEYYAKYARNRTYMTGMPSGNYAPEPRKGKALNDYFKSLNLTDDYIYVMMQFETLGGDPNKEQMKILEDDDVTLFESHGDHTYYAKMPRTILETKSYDFVRWIGIVEKPEWKIQDSNILKKIWGKNCTGMLNISVEFYEKLTLDNFQTIKEITGSCPLIQSRYSTNCTFISKGNIISEMNVSRLKEVASLGFVKELALGVIVSGILGGPGSLNAPEEYDIFEHVNCSEQN